MLEFVERVHIVGCGGIGSWLIGPLLRFLATAKFPGEIMLWDGDHYTTGNAGRQEFSEEFVGANKAAAQLLAFEQTHPTLTLLAREEYVTPRNVGMLVCEGALIFTCVDNHPVRRLIDEAAQGVSSICVLSAGNERLDGNVHVLLRRDGENVTAPLLSRHPEIAESKRGDRSKLKGCEELIEQGAVQLLITNFTAACVALNAFHALWNYQVKYGQTVQEVIPQEIYFDISQGVSAMVPVC